MKRILALTVLLGLASAVQAADPVGSMLLAVGEVTAERGGTAVALTTGAAVERGDEIRTGKASSAQIRFVDTGIVALREDTTFKVDEFVFKGEQDGSEMAVFKLLKGGLRTVTGLIGRLHQKNYGIVTPTSTIGIRGTHFNLVVCEGDCRNADGSIAPSGTYGGVVDGRISLTPNSNAAGERSFAKGEFFFSPNATSPPQQLLVPPTFVADKLEARQRSASKTAVAAGTGTETSTANSSSSSSSTSTSTTGSQTSSDQGAAQPSAASAPLAAPAAETAPAAVQSAAVPLAALPSAPGNAPTAPIATVTLGTATGFIAQYYTGAIYYSLDSCNGAPGTCQVDSATLFTPTGNNLLDYANPPAANPPQGSLGTGTIVDAGSATIAGANYSWGRWTGSFSVTDASGTYTNLPSGVLFGRTDDPNANGASKVWPTTGAVSYVLVGGPRPVDTAGNVGTMNSMTGTLDFVSRNITFQGDMTIGIPTQGTASITMKGSGTLAPGNDNLLGATLNSTCTGSGCAGATSAGQFDARFGGAAAQVMVLNGLAANAVKSSGGTATNSVLFLNMLKCSAGC